VENQAIRLDWTMKFLLKSIWKTFWGASLFLICMPIEASSIDFDGEIVSRAGQKIECQFYQKEPIKTQRDLMASVYSTSKVVHLPGTDTVIVNEWAKVGEIRCVPPYDDSISAEIVSEIAPETIQRGGKLVFTPNQAPVFISIKTPKTAIAPGTKVLIQASAVDPEGDGVTISWFCDRGQWLKEKSRSFYNFFVAPDTEGEVNLKFLATDIFGAETVRETSVIVGVRKNMNLYQHQHVYFGAQALGQETQDAIVSPQGQLLLLEKSRLLIFSPQGILVSIWRKLFQNALKIKVDAANNVYVLDTVLRKILKINAEGKLLTTLQDLSETDDPLIIENPVDFDVSPEGWVYLLDKTLCRILLFDPKGNLVGAIGAKGNQDGQFLSPTAIELGANRSLYVLDVGALKIKVLNESYKQIQSLPLSDRFIYTDFTIDPMLGKMTILANLKGSPPTKTQAYLIEWDLKSPALGQNFKIENTGSRLGKTLSKDWDGHCLLAFLGDSPVYRADVQGHFLGQFSKENPQRPILLAAGPLGTLYFQSGQSIKRLNYFGWVDTIYKNDGNKFFPLAIALRNENLFLLNKGENKIHSYDDRGNHTKDIAFNLASKEKVSGIGVDGQMKIYLLKTSAQVAIYTPDGALEKTVDLKATPTTPVAPGLEVAGKNILEAPFLFFVDHAGTVFLIDKRKNLFLYKNNFSENLSLKGSFQKPIDLSADANGDFYVLDMGSKAIFKYTGNGNLKKEIPLKDKLKHPSRLTAFGDGEVLVFDDADKTVHLYK
jgi:hypothetical protein